MENTASARMTRSVHQIPADVRDALQKNNCVIAYRGRPPYQQNDYVGWITSAKREDTRSKRIVQMIHELKQGNRYMKMKWKNIETT